MKKIISILLGLAFILAFVAFAPQGVGAKNEEPKLKVFVHYPNPGKPATVSSCTPTTNDQVNDYLWAGWQMPAAGMNYKINLATKPKNLTDAQVSSALDGSFATWTAADSKQIFNNTGTTTAKTAKFDGTNALLWKGIQSSAIAITYVWYYSSTGQLAEADTLFNKNYKWNTTAYNGTNDCGGSTDAYDVQNIATHEFGHWVGLDDLYNSVDKDLTMYGYGDLTELKKDTLGLGDVTGVNAIAP